MYTIDALFGYVRHGGPDVCAASASTRLTAAAEGAVQALLVGYAPRCRFPGYSLEQVGELERFPGHLGGSVTRMI